MEESLVPRTQRKKKSKWLTFLSIMGTMIVVGFVLLIFTLLYLRSSGLPHVTIPQTSAVYDLQGNLLEAHGRLNRKIVPLTEMSPHLIHATVAIEDRSFYNHHGISFRGIARAIWVDLRNQSLSQGASTLTQQLARNLYLTHDKTWIRKAKEAIYAVQLEMHYSKDEILAMYLNQMYYGHGAYGVEAAAQLYFGKRAKDLNLSESTLLAGVVKGWKYYSPLMDFERAKSRQKVILNAMVNEQYITQTEANQALNEPVELVNLSTEQSLDAAYFQDYIRKIAIEEIGIDEQLYDTGGMQIYTTLDLHAQQVAEETVKEHLKNEDELQAALVAIDPRTGFIKAMVGGKDYSESQFNRALSTSRQPGSSFKPFVYLAAIEQGMSPTTTFMSEPTQFTYDDGRATYTPQNFNNKYAERPIDMREAISKSDNIYAVHTLMSIGTETAIDLIQRLGMSQSMQQTPSLALGTSTVSPLQMASAYSTIANQGIYVEPTAILKIVDPYGRTIYEANPTGRQVIQPAHAYILTHLMESVFDPGGTASRVASMIKRPVAAKTGTTDADAWMVGFTPELATAVWVGYDRDRKISAAESYKASPIFAEFTEKTLQTVPPKLFNIPDGVVSVYIDPESGLIATADCPKARLEFFAKGTEPTEYCSIHGQQPLLPEVLPETEKKSSWWEDLKRWWND